MLVTAMLVCVYHATLIHAARIHQHTFAHIHLDSANTATSDEQPTTTSAGLAGGKEESHE